jgi:hypothetical protein
MRLRLMEARRGGGAARSRSARRTAPSGPSPRRPLRDTALDPLAPTPLTSFTRPSDDTCPSTRHREARLGMRHRSARSATEPSGWTRRWRRLPVNEIAAKANIWGSGDLEFGGAGQQSSKHRPDAVAQVLAAARTRTRSIRLITAQEASSGASCSARGNACAVSSRHRQLQQQSQLCSLLASQPTNVGAGGTTPWCRWTLLHQSFWLGKVAMDVGNSKRMGK